MSPQARETIRITINGKPRRDLDHLLEKELTVRRRIDVVEGLVLTPEQALSQAMRGMKILYGVTLGLGGAIAIAALIGAASYEPGDLVVLVPLALVMSVGLGFLVRLVYRRNLAKVQVRSEQQASLAAPGTAVRVDDMGLTIGPRRYAWPDIRIDELGLAEMSADESTVVYIERLMLTCSGRTIDLDLLALKNGRDIVNQTWRRLRTPAS